RHLMDLGLLCEIGLGGDKAIRRVPIIGYRQIAHANIGALGRCPRPGILDRDGTRLCLFGVGQTGKEKNRHHREGGKYPEHADFCSTHHLSTVKLKLPCVLWVSTEVTCQLTLYFLSTILRPP